MRRDKKRRNLTGVDIVAIILAIGVSLVLCLIIIGTIVQILHNAPLLPEIQLSENATQILIAGIGGIIGVLGSYIGYRVHNTHPKEKYMIEERPERPEPTENDDKEDVEPLAEPEVEGDPHGSPLDREEDRQFLRPDGPGTDEVA